MSLSCPGNVCLHWPSRMSHNFADASHAPDTKARQCGDSDNAITSPVCPINEVACWPVSMSHKPHDISPELVTICGVEKRENRLGVVARNVDCSAYRLQFENKFHEKKSSQTQSVQNSMLSFYFYSSIGLWALNWHLKFL